jgi:hypothetical protein
MFENNGGDTVGDESKAKVIVAADAIAWAGEIFCNSCYTLEGDSNLVFSADAVLSKADDFTGINANDFNIPNGAIDEGINKAIDIMKASEQHLQDRLNEAQEILSRKQQIVDQRLARITEMRTQQEINSEINDNNGRVDYLRLSGNSK